MCVIILSAALFISMLNVFMLCVVMLSAVMLSVIILSVVMLSVVMLSFVMLSVVILSVAASVSIHRSIIKIKHFCIRKTIQLIMEQSSRYKFRSFGFYFHSLAKEN
jgi:hypothetical protein